MDMPDIEFEGNGGIATGYLAVPTFERGPATVVLQEQWGLDGHIRSVCDRLASEGFFALAPDLRRGEVTTQTGEAELQTALSIDSARQDLRTSVEHLLSITRLQGRGVGAVGFGSGGGLAIWAAAAFPQIAATVAYYCTLPDGKPNFSQITGPVLGHFGTADVFISLKDAKALEMNMRMAGVDVEFEKYTGAGHGFFDQASRLGNYDEWAAARSWRRSVSFLRSALASPELSEPDGASA
jgi:carboxymethylenebutenolidase